MPNRKEEQPLAEIQRRVLARDASRHQREKEVHCRAATREARTEMTALSQEQVDRIADVVRAKADRQPSRRRIGQRRIRPPRPDPSKMVRISPNSVLNSGPPAFLLI